ncbi:MAG: Cys-Gln thioester bond-forming surface protein [Eggerthellaceae bacterium]|nr:Cys-Gln thioester bond-forming surface protein [Eggerthellaceae bacterium]
MSVNPKTLVEKFIRDSKGRSRLAAVTGVLAVFTVLITVGVLTFPAISISGSEEALREQGIDITTGQQQQEAEVVAPPADEAPMVVYDEASQAADAESSENVAEAITEETTVGDVVVSDEANLAADAPVEGEAIESTDAPVEGEETTEEVVEEGTEAEEELVYSQAAADALAAADLSSSRLIIGTSNADALAEETNVVANFDNIYLLQFASAEEAAKGFLKYFDIADYVTPDVAVEIAEGEDNSDPEEEVITTDNVYTEEENPFAELETALVEETTVEADAAAASNEVALIALIDTGASIDTNVVEAVSMLGEETSDENGHGQRMVDFIVEENEEAQILSIKALASNGKGDVSAVIAAINYAMERGASIINLSMSAYASEENAALAEAVKRAEEAGIVVVGAAGNNGFNAKFYIPGNIAEATIVGASDEQGVRIKQSNFGETVDYNFWAGSTSEAAARMSGFISANGEEGVAAVLNQGRIFTTDYVASPAEEPAVEEGTTDEEPDEGEETPDEANQDTEITAQEANDVVADRSTLSTILPEEDGKDYGPLDNQSNANATQLNWQKGRKIWENDKRYVATWDALNEVITNEKADVIYLDTRAFLSAQDAEQAKSIAAYYTIPVDRDITIIAGNITEIYHDAQPKTEMTSYFKVKDGATLTLDGVTLTGKQAYTAHAKISNNVGRVALEANTTGQWAGYYEVKLYDSNGNVHWLDKLSKNDAKIINGLKSVIAVAPGTLSDPPVAGEPFAIREKEPQANGNYRFLIVDNNMLLLREVSPDNVLSIAGSTTTTTDPETGESGTLFVQNYDTRFLWNIAETPASFLYNTNSSSTQGFAIIHDGYYHKADWKNTPPQLKSSKNGYRVEATDVSYEVSSTTHGYFVDIEEGGTLTLTNGSKIEYAKGGNSAIKSDGGNINIYDGVEISNNKSSDSAYKTEHHWAGGNSTYASDARKNDAASAGAINMVGGELNIVCSDPSKGIKIHDNRGGATNTAGAIRISGTQAQVLGNVAIYDNRARKNDKFNAAADMAEMQTWLGADGSVDRTKVQAARRDMHLNGVGTGSYIVNLSMYQGKDPVTDAKMEILVTAWESAGAILAEDGATLTIGSKTEKDNTPQIYGNTGEAGAIRITGSNTVVDQYYATIGGKPENPNYGTNGGAVHVSEGTYNMHTGEMSWNGAWGKGGAVAVSLDGTFNLGDADGYGNDLDAPEIAHNLATFNGGGVYIESNKVNLYYGDINDNLAGMYGGGVYVTGDSLSTTYNLRFPDPVDEDIANAYVYENDAYRKINNRSEPYGEFGDGGGMWSCPWGSYLYKEDRLAIFANSAERNGDDFTKQGSSNPGQGMGAAFEPVPGHVWRYDHAGTARHGEVLYPEYVFPTNEYMNLKSDLTKQQVNIPTAKQAVLIHGNKASDGAGIGSNGIITFEDLPEYYKVISAKLKLDKKWNDTSANHDGRKVKLEVRILDADGNPVKVFDNNGTQKERDPYTVTLDGSDSDEKYADETATGKITWNKWHATIDLPTYTFSIKNLLRQALVDSGLSTDEANAVLENTSDLSQIDQLQEQLGSTNADPKRYAYVIDYLKAKVEGGTAPNASVSDEFAATVAFDGWQIEIKETILKSDGTIEENPPYSLDFGKLYFSKKNPDALYSSKYVDTGRNFIVYTDEYELSTELTNWNTEIKVNKVDQDDNPLPGATFAIYKVDDDNTETLVEQKTMGEEETSLVFKGLSAGTYKVREISAPDGYNKHVGDYIITIDKNGATGRAEYVAVDSTTGQLAVGGNLLYVDKLPANEAALNALSDKYAVNNLTTTTFGSHYPLIVGLYENGTTQTGLATSTDYVVSATDTTNYPGIIHFLKDRKHVGSPDHNHASIIYGYADSAFTLANLKNQGPDTINQFTWNKVTTDNGFELFASKTGKYLIIDNEGNPVLTQNLATAAAAAKATSDAAFSTDAEGMLNIKVGNTKEEGWASVDKVDESGNSLSGAELHIIDADTREVIEVEINGQKVTSWESTGQPIAVKLPAGNYKLVEVTPPSGYTLAAPCEFTVTKQNNSTSNAVVVRMEDKLQPAGEISVLKVDENKVPLAGAKLAIVKKSDPNNYVKQWTSSASPMVFSTDDFEEGVEYQVIEIEPPFGYERNENVAYPTFTVRKNHSSQAANGSLSHPGVSVTHSTVKGSYIQLSKSGKTNIGYCVSMHNHYLTTTSSTDAVLLDDATSEFFNSNTTVSNKPGGRVNVNENMLKAIKHALYIGYPNDSANLLGKNLISEKDFYKVTQAVIWHYTTNGGFDSLSASYDNTWNTNWSGWYQGIFEVRSTNANSWYQRIIRYIDALVAGNTNATLDGVNASGFGAPDSFKVNLFKFGSDQPVVETYPTEQVIPPLQLENKLRKGKITITKQWANEDGSSVSIPVDSVDVQLTRSVDGVPDDNFSQVITITKANNWVATQDGLDLVDPKTTKPYQYSISENTNVAGFSATVTGPTTVETSKVTYNVATTSSSATWNATTYLSNNDTFVFTRSGDSKVLTVDGNSVKWVNLSGSSAANAPAEAQWKAILANSNNSSYYLQNVKTGKYLKLGNRVGNNGQSYWSYYYDCTATTSNAERFRLVNYSSSYYSDSYALQGVTATSNSNGYGIEISTVDGQLSYYNTAYVKPYKKNVTSDTSTNQQDLYTEFEATVFNAGIKHDFELLKIDSSKLNSLPNSIDSLDSIKDIDGLDGAVFTLKNNNEGDNKDAYLTKDNTWKNTTNKDAEVRFTTEDGKVSFGGLLAGSYILEEVQVPEHYVQADGLLWNVTVKNDGTIEVETHANAVKDKFVVFGNAAAIVIGNDIQTYVLPATGGIGTTVFVIGGALLMLLAAALFVRRGAKKEA